MSGIALIWAANVKGLKPAAKIVLIQLADFHNKETGQCNPSAQRLADECEMDRATVFRHLTTLENKGLLTRHSRGDGTGGRSSNHYQLHLDVSLGPSAQVEEKPQIATVGKVAKCDGGSRSAATGVVAKCDGGSRSAATGVVAKCNRNLTIEPGIEPEIPPVGPPKRKSSKRATELPEDWTPSLQNITDAKNRNFSEEEINHEAERFRDYHRAKGTRFKDWNAGWRTWLGNARRFATSRGLAGQQDTGRGRSGGSLASIAARRQLGG